MKALRLLLYFSLLSMFSINAYTQILWKPAGPGGGGWISAITVTNDPLYTIYVGFDVGGVYKSTDPEENWKPVNDGLGVLYFNALAVDPSDPSVIYAGSSGNGIYKEQ